jgi:hypothetical protein
VVAKVRERLAVNKQRLHKSHIERFNLKKLNKVEGTPVPTAWRVLGLRMEERPPDMEVSCEYIE